MEIPNSPLPPAAGLPPSPFKYILSITIEEIAPYLVIVSATYHYKKLLTMVVNTSTGGPGDWFGICSSISDALMTSATAGISTSS